MNLKLVTLAKFHQDPLLHPSRLQLCLQLNLLGHFNLLVPNYYFEQLDLDSKMHECEIQYWAQN
jgi:hypothetical protein